MLDVSPVRAFSDNYIWLIHSPANPSRVAAVDPGDARPVEAHLRLHGLDLRAVLVTHHHPDHVGGVATLAASHAVEVIGPSGVALPEGARRVADGDRVAIDSLGLDFAVLGVPGHTLDHLAYLGHGALFCGDTLFSAGCGRLFEGSAAQMHESLTRLTELPADTRVYCGHEYTLANLRFAQAVEPENRQITERLAETELLRAAQRPSLPSTIGRELEYNPFLRCDREPVRRAAERHSGHRMRTPIEVFAAVRAWKDGFRLEK
jgi:hydroxyacylglutathione hydrolase